MGELFPHLENQENHQYLKQLKMQIQFIETKRKHCSVLHAKLRKRKKCHCPRKAADNF